MMSPLIPHNHEYADYLFSLSKKVDNNSLDIGGVLKDLEIKSNKIKYFNFNIPIVSFEGERCSGKDSQINFLKKKYKSQLYFVERTNNPAWEVLQAKKRNIYFNLDNILLDSILFAADLHYRFYKALDECESKPIIWNRYIHSFLVIHQSLLVHRGIHSPVFNCLFLFLIRFLPLPSIVFYLSIAEAEVYKRFWGSGGRIMNLEEKEILRLNLKGFNNIQDKSFIKLNGHNDVQLLNKSIVKILIQNKIIYNDTFIS